MFACLTIVATVAAGYLVAPWWVCGIGVALLITDSLAQQRPYQADVLAAGGVAFLTQMRLSAGLTATAIGLAAFATGLALGSLIGQLESYLRAVI